MEVAVQALPAGLSSPTAGCGTVQPSPRLRCELLPRQVGDDAARQPVDLAPSGDVVAGARARVAMPLG
eukprot:11732261-Alexandrium_andersonii.AAC.1